MNNPNPTTSDAPAIVTADLIAQLRALHATATTALGGREVYVPLAEFNEKIEAYDLLDEHSTPEQLQRGGKDVCRVPEYEDPDDYKEIFNYLASAAQTLPLVLDSHELLRGQVTQLRAALEEMEYGCLTVSEVDTLARLAAKGGTIDERKVERRKRETGEAFAKARAALAATASTEVER